MKHVAKKLFMSIGIGSFISCMFFTLVMQSFACDVAVVAAKASTTGRPFIWKNFDCSAYWQQQIKYFPAKNAAAGGYFLLYHEDDYMTLINGSPVTPQAGVNEAGFSIALTSVYENLNLTHEAGNLNTDLMQEAVEKCVRLSDFESLVKSWPWAHLNHAVSGNFVVIDAYGGAALYEMFTGYYSMGYMPIMYRKYDANTGRVVNERGTQLTAAQTNFIGFVNRTNSHSWLPANPGDEREIRGRALLTSLATARTLSPQTMMRTVARDVNGKQVNPSSYSSYNTTYCISRSATRSGTVIDGVASGGNPKLTTFWCALGEPSISVFVPYFASAKGISYLTYIDTIDRYGRQYDQSDTCLLNMAEDEWETYNNLLYSSNRGDTAFGPYDSYINKYELDKVQKWAFAIEDTLFDNTDYFLDRLRSNSALATQQNLKAYSDYCAEYAYDNYTSGSASAAIWNYVMP